LLIESEGNSQSYKRMIETIRTNRCLAFAGAGVSRVLGYPLWTVLLDRFATETRKQRGETIVDDEGGTITVTQVAAIDDLLVRAEIFKANLGERYCEIVRDTFSPKSPPTSEIRDLAKLPFQHILTSNYDIAIEMAHDSIQLKYEAICLHDGAARAFVNKLADYGYPKKIVHVHGKYDDPHNIVLTEKEYASLYNGSQVVQKFWGNVPIYRTCVFFGFSFTDQDITAWFNLNNFNRAVRDGYATPHFALIALDDSRDEAGFRRECKVKYGVDPVFFRPMDSQYSGYGALVRKMVGDTVPDATELAARLDVGLPVESDYKTASQGNRDAATETTCRPDPITIAKDLARLETLTVLNMKKSKTGELR
jgi:hypothetical protein